MTNNNLPTPTMHAQPKCHVRDRLRLWKPHCSDNTPSLTPDMVKHIKEVIGASWAASTLETYGTGLAIFHSFCDHLGISELDRAPAPATLLASFALALAGIYAPSTISNYLAGVRAWHVLHLMELNAHKPTMDALLRGTERLAPPEVKRAEHKPFRIANICSLCEKLDLTNPLDAAVFTCVMTTFWGAACLGETTVCNIEKFDPKVNIVRATLSSAKLGIPVIPRQS